MAKRYSPTKVTRYIMNGVDQIEVEYYADATVRDNGASNWLRVPEAMLRAYPNTKKLAKEWDKHDEWFVVDDERAEYYGEEMKGYVLDCDGDVALQRIMGIVLGKHSFGHGSEEWVMLVGQDDDGEYNGWGHDNYRIEKWRVTIK